MNKRDLKKLSKSQLIKMLLKQEKKKPEIIVVDDTKKTNKSKQQKVYNHGNLFNDDPFPEFVVTNDPFENRMIKATNKGRYINERTSYIDKKYKSIMSSLDDVKPFPKPSERPIPKSRTYKPLPASRFNKPKYKARPPVPTPRNKVNQLVQHYENNIIERPVPKPRTKITQIQKALKNSTKSFAVDIVDNKDPLYQLTETKKVTEHYLNKELGELKGFKYIETLKMTFEKQLGGEIITKTVYFNSKTKTLINENEINEVLQTSRQELMKIIGQWLSEGSGWTIKSVDAHYINLTKYAPMNGSSYIQLPTELRNSAKGLINLKNEDNECFRWCHIRYLNPQGKDPQRIKKDDRQYIKNLDYQGIKFPVTIKQINKIEKQNNIRINVFGYENKQSYPIYISKEKFKDDMNLLLITNDKTNTTY